MAKSPYTPEIKALISQRHLAGESAYILADELHIHSSVVYRWAQKYKEMGIEAFSYSGKNASYTSEFKRKCVMLYLKGDMSADDIVAKYSISSLSVLQGWIKRYNANRELKDYCPKQEVYMAEARRKTTIEER